MERADIETILIDTQRLSGQLVVEIQRLAGRVEALRLERSRIAAVLARFYRAEISMSSVEPVLELAKEMNPELRWTSAFTRALVHRGEEPS